MQIPKLLKCELEIDFNQKPENSTKLCSVYLPKDAKILKDSFSSDGKTFFAIYEYQPKSSFLKKAILIAKQGDSLHINLNLNEISHLKTVYHNGDILHIFEVIK